MPGPRVTLNALGSGTGSPGRTIDIVVLTVAIQGGYGVGVSEEAV